LTTLFPPGTLLHVPDQNRSRLVLKIMLLLLSLVMLLAGGVILVAWPRLDHMAPARLVLPDGTTVSVAGATFGTNHVFGGPLARWVARTPAPVQSGLARLLGARAVAHKTFTTPVPTLVVWVYSPVVSNPPPAGAFPGWYEVYLANTNGFVSGLPENFTPGVGGLSQLQFTAFPRRDRTLALHFYHRDYQGQSKQCGVLEFLNPACSNYPQWNAETLPVTRRTGDVEATLERVSTGHGGNSSYSTLADGSHAIAYNTNREDGRNDTACLLHLRSLSDTNQSWQVEQVALSDATGNAIRSMTISWSGSGDDVFDFGPGLWTGEAAWKMRCEIKRTRGFAPGELFTFKNVPLDEMYETNYLGWSSNVNRVTVTLDYFVRRPPLAKNNWSSSQFSEAHFIIRGVSNDFNVDLVETRADNGTNIECPSWSGGGNFQDHYFRNVPLDAKTLDFTFAIHQGRWVEFVVKPDTGSARFEYPAPPKPKKPE
jgi:hypothetical protein